MKKLSSRSAKRSSKAHHQEESTRLKLKGEEPDTAETEEEIVPPKR